MGGWRSHLLAAAAGTEEDDLREVVVHVAELLGGGEGVRELVMYAWGRVVDSLARACWKSWRRWRSVEGAP